MDWLARLRHEETARERAARACAESSWFITECMRRPELAVRIPMIPTGAGRFPPSLSTSFWDSVLNDGFHSSRR